MWASVPLMTLVRFLTPRCRYPRMWLLNTRTHELKWFASDNDRPPYAILSHVWGNDEVSLADIQDLSKAKEKRGFTKIEHSCAVALQEGYEWVWIDTCCIDKSSSAELSEAINSMYAWYGAADVCFAYLEDVEDSSEEDPSGEGSSFRSSRWFTRGWTLQELLAPRSLYFLALNWTPLGTKRSLAEVLQDVTSISQSVLLHEYALEDISIARKMSWASRRETTRVEDRAYSLMGIFGVNMPTIYGEGEKAFIRLQLEIIRHDHDQSIFAWGTIRDYHIFLQLQHKHSFDTTLPNESRSLLASSPDMFAESANIQPIPLRILRKEFKMKFPVRSYAHTNYGIHIHLPLVLKRDAPNHFGLLACRDDEGMIGLLLGRMRSADSKDDHQYYVGLHKKNTTLRFPHFRAFRIPTEEKARKAFMGHLVGVEATGVYIHSFPQRGFAAKPVVRAPDRFAFIIPGWRVKLLEETGFKLDHPKDSQDRPGWTPTEVWKDQNGQLTLTIPRESAYRQAVVIFQGPSEEAFALVTGVTQTGLAWADAVVKGTASSLHHDWHGSGHDVARRICDKYNDVGSAEDLGLYRWELGKRNFGDERRTIAVTFTPWERGAEVRRSVAYVIGIELEGIAYLECMKSSSSGHQEGKSSTIFHTPQVPLEARPIGWLIGLEE